MSTSTLLYLVASWWMIRGWARWPQQLRALRFAVGRSAKVSKPFELAEWLWRIGEMWKADFSFYADMNNEDPKSKLWCFWMLVVDFCWFLLTWFGKRKDSQVETQLRALKLLTLQPVCHGCRKRCFYMSICVSQVFLPLAGPTFCWR